MQDGVINAELYFKGRAEHATRVMANLKYFLYEVDQLMIHLQDDIIHGYRHLNIDRQEIANRHERLDRARSMRNDMRKINTLVKEAKKHQLNSESRREIENKIDWAARNFVISYGVMLYADIRCKDDIKLEFP